MANIKQDSRFCKHCNKQTLAQARKPSKIHTVLDFTSLGIWFIFVHMWILMKPHPYRCQICGTKV
ncbi:MAG: hypothetical protein LC623_07000 [Halobacteriales archaeon]|nr:hypothetical protein [Halobacteriales archaeon]